MVKKILFATVVLAFLALSVFSVYLMYNNDDKYSIKFESGDIVPISRDVDDMWEVRKGTIIDKLEVNAIVSPLNEDALKVIEINGSKSDITVNVKVGDTIEKSYLLAKKGDKEYSATAKMRCLDIKWSQYGCTITFLDYSKLYIEADIPENALSYDLFSKDFSFNLGDRTIPAKLSYLDYVNNNGYVTTKYTYDNQADLFLPGTKLVCDTILNKKENVLTLPTLFVIVKNGSYFVETNEGGEIITKPIKVGSLGIDNVEIVSGIVEGEMVLCPNEEFSLANQLNQGLSNTVEGMEE